MLENIKIVNIKDSSYPFCLRKIKNPPEKLFYIGKLPEKKEKLFAIVGTRMASHYGKQVALEIAGDLAENNLIIVSGLAPGIDTFSHSAAVERKKRTIAVLGTGLDKKSIYPQSNLKLAEEILENNGCLISEYPATTRGTRFTFPKRNRIIAGLSLGVLVIEAKEKSGSLITARYAFQQNKKVFAVPGSIYSSNSKGCHYLIKKGAQLIENANDILEVLKIKSFKNKRGQEISGENKEEILILETLKEEALNIEKIIEKTKLSASAVASNLAILEIKGKIKNLGGNIYALSR